jgi:hypothetical protein
MALFSDGNDFNARGQDRTGQESRTPNRTSQDETKQEQIEAETVIYLTQLHNTCLLAASSSPDLPSSHSPTHHTSSHRIASKPPPAKTTLQHSSRGIARVRLYDSSSSRTNVRAVPRRRNQSHEPSDATSTRLASLAWRPVHAW